MPRNSVSHMFVGTFPQVIASIIGTINAISDGMHYAWTAPVIPILLSDHGPFKITKSDESLLETILLIGGLCGLPITMFLVNKIGRHRSICAASCASIISWLLIALAPRVEYVYVSRFLAGIAGNMTFIAAPVYVAEIADQKIRGFLSGIIFSMMLVGIVLIYSVAPFVPFYIPSVIAASLLLIQLVSFRTMPESPYYLLTQGKKEAAKVSLKRFRPDADVDEELEEMTASITREKMEKGRLVDLVLVSNNRMAFVIIAIVNAAQHLCGSTVILMNLHMILGSAGSISLDSNTTAILFSILMLVAGLVASFYVDKYGRVFFLVVSSVLTGICLIALAIYFHLRCLEWNLEAISWLPVVSVMIYAIVFKLGLGTIPIILAAELFSNRIKAVGMTISDAGYVIFASLSIEVYQRLADAYGIHIPLYLFAFFFRVDGRVQLFGYSGDQGQDSGRDTSFTQT